MNYIHAERRGRRPGASGTRDAIERAARRLFGERGYDRTTLRAIAAEAGVDPALVAHFFGSKQKLFVSVVELPFDPAQVASEVIAGGPDSVGHRFARFVVGILEDPEARSRVTGIVRAAASEPEAARILREQLTARLLVLAEALGTENAPLRATLAGSQVVGVVMARHVVGVEPLASTGPDELVEALAPTFQRYLAGPL